MEIRKITQSICFSQTAGEACNVEMVADTETGNVQLIITKSVTERYKITDMKKVLDLYERLTKGGGRHLWSLEELTQ